jgi:hypothetical protein
MRWQTVVAALGLGMMGGAGWMFWDLHRSQADGMTPHFEVSSGDIPLMVQHDRGALRLRWSPKAEGIRDAQHGSLTISDGTHRSKLELDGPELRAGMASYWPEGSRVGFRLETDSGASGSIEAPAGLAPKAVQKEAEPVKKPVEPKATSTAKSPPPLARKLPRPSVNTNRAPIDDGLEWTEQPRRDSRWSRLKRKIRFWRKPEADDR